MMGEVKPVKTTLLVALVALACCSTGCRKREQEIKVYRLVKAPLEEPIAPPAVEPAAEMPGLPPSHPPIGSARSANTTAATSSAPSAPVPSNWEAQPLSEMRKASYLVHGQGGSSADVSFVALGGSGGDILGNVNRWLGQIKRPPITDDQLDQVVQHMPSELGHVVLVDLRGEPEAGDPKKDGRILAAIATGDGGTSFYKMRGNSELIEVERENFTKWVAAMRESR